ncbi:MAG: hypothetical protein Ta2A_05860 [Treponemataceae bacterium]|nr:MAG: hypothetical protein Ta2A_05860 [Treponemataceae bacterium]
MPHNANGYETAYSQFGSHARSVHPDVSRRIFAASSMELVDRTLSPSVSGASVASNLHLVRLTESGATPPLPLALLLLARPLLLILQKAEAALIESAPTKRLFYEPSFNFAFILLFAFLHPFNNLISNSIAST